MNDGKVDRQGRFVAGSMDFEESNPVGKLFRLDPDLSVHSSTTASSVPTARAGAPTARRSISPIPVST